jgi:transposase
MIAEHIREAVRTLFESGKRKKEIARFLRIDIKTVRAILTEEQGEAKSRKDKILVDYDLLKDLHERCSGYAQRMHEILTEEHKIPIGYSTLTRLLREYGIGRHPEQRSQKYPDIPGAEIQHDTSVYTVKLGQERRRLVCSGLYFRYSKMRYVKFYIRFNRFLMKCFFHEALRFFSYTAKTCIIDNTNLAVLYGTGENAVFHPEMLAFARKYGFQWKAHRIRQSNRKAGKERNFLTLETNFFPGRSFADIEDLNRQVFEWATRRFASRPLARTRLIPQDLFEQEKPYLVKLAEYIDPPYQEHKRSVDPYGYMAFDSNYYWVPEKLRGKLTVIEYEKYISIYHHHRKLMDYELAPWNVKNKQITPQGVAAPSQAPWNKRYGCKEEEKRLREMGDVCCAYLDYVHSKACRIPQKPRFIRELYRLAKKMSRSLFLSTIERAFEYQISSITSIERIAAQLIKQQMQEFPDIPPSKQYENRESYQEGRFSTEADLKRYRQLMEEQEDG